MENQKNDNLNLLEAVVQNTEMGKNTLEQIVPMTEDAPFKAELLRERNIYRQLNQEAHTAIEACGGTAQGQSAMAKLNTKMGIGMKTLTDKSTRNLAEMLSEGSSQGVMDCIKSQKDYPDRKRKFFRDYIQVSVPKSGMMCTDITNIIDCMKPRTECFWR